MGLDVAQPATPCGPCGMREQWFWMMSASYCQEERVGSGYRGLTPTSWSWQDRGGPVLSVVELTCDHVLDLGLKRGVRAEDEFAQHWYQGTVFAG